MKFFLISIIRLYWLLLPVTKRKKCLFDETCSNHVYRITCENGGLRGLQALIRRYKQCRSGYTIYKDEKTGAYSLYLKDGTVINEADISISLMPPYNYKYSIKKDFVPVNKE